MKKSYFLILFFAYSICSNAQTGKEVFMQKYCVLDDFLKGKMSELPPLYEARTFLIELTGITYYMEQPLENMLLPPDKTMIEWMKWFEDNQDKLYWDKNRKKVILKER